MGDNQHLSYKNSQLILNAYCYVSLPICKKIFNANWVCQFPS